MEVATLFADVKRMNKRQFLYQVLSFGMIVTSALMIWKGLMVVTGSESPIVVVLSGSMEPAFHRGDLLFLTNYPDEPVRVGEIVVFKVEGRDIPIVHRVLKLHEKNNGTVKFLTKGDNNSVDDRGLYAPGQLWLTKKDVVGRARGFLPYVGMVTILMNEYPKFKYIYRILQFIISITGVCLLWKAFIVSTGLKLVVVLSESMEPFFTRGDLLVLSYNPENLVQVGHMILFKLEGRDVPVMHRVIKTVKGKDAFKCVTKGDNNSLSDLKMYPPERPWLTNENIIGKVEGYCPYIGHISILFEKYPILKIVILASLGYYFLAE